MQNETRYDLTITGNGESGGGRFRNVKVLGDAKIAGDLDCLAFHCTGTANIAGSVKSGSCRITGTVDLQGDLETGKARVIGTLDIGGNVKTTEMTSTGETRIRGGLAGEHVELNGLFAIRGDCEAETLRMKGVFTIEGLVNAGTVSLHIHSQCRVKEIGGEKIEIRRGTDSLWKRWIGAFYLPSDFYAGVLQAETIEGDDIYVEHTSARVIRGTNVVIGPGCRVGHVEYADRFEQADDSIVEFHAKV